MSASDASQAIASNSSGSAGSTYILRSLINDIPLTSEDSEGSEAHITCVDAWNGNLYIGTSAGEVLHYVSIPSDPSDESGQPTYIFATKITPQYKHRQEGADAGVKQILVLPAAGKACILCHGTLNFYTLPELSPAFGGQIQQGNCTWVGGLDANSDGGLDTVNGGVVVIICLKTRLRLIRIPTDSRNSNKPSQIRNIELGGVSSIQRRGDLACVADGRTYTLLDVVNQRKNDLFPISSLLPPEPDVALPQPQALAAPNAAGSPARRTVQSPARQTRQHERSTSHGSRAERLQAENSTSFPPRSSSHQSHRSADLTRREVSPAAREEQPPPPPPSTAGDVRSTTDVSATETPTVESVDILPPNIACPTPNEFLLTTGTRLSEPGVGMFVNMDGDPTRGTLEFSSYPESMVLDGPGSSDDSSDRGLQQSEGYVLAIVRRKTAAGLRKGIEIQLWDAEAGDSNLNKEWLPVEASERVADNLHCGLQIASTAAELHIPEISSSLRLRQLSMQTAASGADEHVDEKRNKEEDKFVSRFAQASANVLLHHGNQVSWVSKNALVLQYDRQLDIGVRRGADGSCVIDVPGVQKVLNSIRGQEPRDELEFLTLTYIRQKASLLLFGNLIFQTVKNFTSYERDKRFAEEALEAGDIDPRVILMLVPLLDREVVQGESGIWIAQGLRDTISMIRESVDLSQIVQGTKGAYGENLLSIVRRYLLFWRSKKGFGSVADESYVFQTVDAALLLVLLKFDENQPPGPAVPGSIRAELNEIVDRGVDCFDRAVRLFEEFKRLHVLSRLYQSRKSPAQVLATWKRIMEGEEDKGGELIDGEHDVKRYLLKIRDTNLVREYGAWLANRNPKLGVEVFADEGGKVKFSPADAVKLLKEKAPGAVKFYLEHLVFEKNHVQYVNDLIAFYLEIVLDELETSQISKQALLDSYETYRALHPPKPTYGRFTEDNSADVEWQQSRLRLLQLIGGSHGAASKYDVHALRQRLAPYSDELVPEMIILNGREGKHEEALRLLTHGLGDYDTAIRYCLRGGSSIFQPGTSGVPEQPLPSKEEQSELFEHLLLEFFRIRNETERLECTAGLLERFGGWFDIADVLALIPDSWSVETVAEFLISALQRLVGERNETVVIKALSSAQNLRQSVDVIEKIEGMKTKVRVETVGEVDVG